MKSQPTHRFTLALLGVFASAQGTEFTAAANQFLSIEVPKMEAAAAAKDRAYFAAGIEQVNNFVNAHGTQLETSPACAEAVSDFLIVGLCRISPPGSICEPTTFTPRFESNLAKCRAAANANQTIRTSP